MLRAGIKRRMEKRFLQQNMTAEVEQLHKVQKDSLMVSVRAFRKIGVEYRFISEFYKAKLHQEDLFSRLCTAICQFVKDKKLGIGNGKNYSN